MIIQDFLNADDGLRHFGFAQYNASLSQRAFIDRTVG